MSAPGLTWGTGRPEDLDAYRKADEQWQAATRGARHLFDRAVTVARERETRAMQEYLEALRKADKEMRDTRWAWEDLQAARGVKS